MSSPRKPYQKLGSSRLKFFSAPARHLMESGSSESVFEKPYRDSEYGDMHQSPNTPSVSPGGGLGEGFNCYYTDSVCGEGIECFIGTSIPVTGGPYEAQAGFREPVAQEGEITDYTIDGANDRHILINVDPGKVTHSILVEYIDSYGKSHHKAITLDCDFLRDLWRRLDLWGLGDLWGGAKVRTEVAPPFSVGSWTDFIAPFSAYNTVDIIHSGGTPYSTGHATHTPVINGDFDLYVKVTMPDGSSSRVLLYAEIGGIQKTGIVCDSLAAPSSGTIRVAFASIANVVTGFIYMRLARIDSYAYGWYSTDASDWISLGVDTDVGVGALTLKVSGNRGCSDMGPVYVEDLTGL